ncbi:MAG: NAD(P)/FAD-dependent oxidoreductase [Oscillospiraceae bacterium]|nr:NAD(P)/FAD-dependent oxidoreductase [Oscillospiraceae bacterium]
MEKYDVLIVGASTTGCHFAHKMTEKGFRVLVIEKEQPENVSRSYDIFHMSKAEIEQFDLELPDESNPVREFSFTSSPMISPYGNHPKEGGYFPVVGFHKHDYIMLMAERAKNSGAEIIYGASFEDFIFDDLGRIIGAKYKTDEGEKEAFARIVADCSGIPSAARTKLPDTSVVENGKLSPRDVFFVVLYYVKYLDRELDPRSLDGFFMQYKSWSAPAGEDYDAILGIGAGHSFEYAEEVFHTQFMKNVKFPEFTVEKIERGLTPYRRSVYSFVDDGFIVLGDAACLTKPTSGEGCTSSLVLSEIAVEVISNFLKSDKFLTKERMWSINKRYMKAQGKDFDSMRPLLMGVIAPNFDEAEYLFANDIIFSQKILGGANSGIQIDGKDIADIIKGITKGIATKKLKSASIGKLLWGLKKSVEVGGHYDDYPDDPKDFPEWKEKAEELWSSIGSLADTCDPAIIEKLNK